MDKQEMEKMYEDHVKTVYKYVYCLAHDANIAEELTQETFYRAMKSLHTFRGTCKLSVWLCQIAKHLWYQELARKKSGAPPEDPGESYATPNSMEGDCLNRLEKMELFTLLHRFDAQTREVMYLRLTGELSFAEIGEIMEKTETWARVTFYRGKQKLAKGREEWNKN